MMRRLIGRARRLIGRAIFEVGAEMLAEPDDPTDEIPDDPCCEVPKTAVTDSALHLGLAQQHNAIANTLRMSAMALTVRHSMQQCGRMH